MSFWKHTADPTHPLWGFLRLSVMMTALTLVLWMNASHFDNTELRSIITLFIVGAGVEGVTAFFRKGTPDDDKKS